MGRIVEPSRWHGQLRQQSPGLRWNPHPHRSIWAVPCDLFRVRQIRCDLRTCPKPRGFTPPFTRRLTPRWRLPAAAVCPSCRLAAPTPATGARTATAALRTATTRSRHPQIIRSWRSRRLRPRRAPFGLPEVITGRRSVQRLWRTRVTTVMRRAYRLSASTMWPDLEPRPRPARSTSITRLRLVILDEMAAVLGDHLPGAGHKLDQVRLQLQMLLIVRVDREPGRKS